MLYYAALHNNYYTCTCTLHCVFQLRGLAEKRQVDGARVGMQHNFGIGGAAVVTIYRRLVSPLSSGTWSLPSSKL